MSHRIAELIAAADAATTTRARVAAEKAATDLILRTWEHRSSWPLGWPPHDTAKVLAALDPETRQDDRPPSGSVWLDSLARLDALHARERRLWVNLALLDLDFEAEERAIAEGGGDLRDDERSMIEGLLQRRASAAAELLVSGMPTSAEELTSTAAHQFSQMSEEGTRLIEEVVKAGDVRGPAVPAKRVNRQTARGTSAPTARPFDEAGLAAEQKVSAP